MNDRTQSLLIALIVVLFVVTATVAVAHKSEIEVELKDGKIELHCGFSGHAPMKKAKVQVYDEQGKQVVEGKTDDKGRFSFDPPENAETLQITVQDLMGHRAETKVKLEELK